MPEPLIPNPTPDRGVSRNLFVEADPDLDALGKSTGDAPARSVGGRRHGHGVVVLAEQHRSPHRPRARDAERFTRPNGNTARCRAAGCHVIRQADAAAGWLLRNIATRPYRALVTIVALTLLLFAFSWLVLDLRDMSTARGAANARLARNAVTLRHKQARIGALTTELRQVAQTARESQTSAAPARPLGVGPRPTTRNRPTAGPYHRHR